MIELDWSLRRSSRHLKDHKVVDHSIKVDTTLSIVATTNITIIPGMSKMIADVKFFDMFVVVVAGMLSVLGNLYGSILIHVIEHTMPCSQYHIWSNHHTSTSWFWKVDKVRVVTSYGIVTADNQVSFWWMRIRRRRREYKADAG